MTATLDQAEDATHATSAPLLNFDVINERAGQILGIAPEDITDRALGELFGLSRETIWHYRHGTIKREPRFATVSAMADKLGLSVDDIRAQGTPSPPRPAAPSTPKPPAAPKPASPSKAA